MEELPKSDIPGTHVILKNIALGDEVREWTRARAVVEVILPSNPPKALVLCTLIPGKVQPV